jgi:hypothetical protein
MAKDRFTFDGTSILQAIQGRLNSELQIYLIRIRQRSSEMLGAGIAPEEIRNTLIDDIKNKSGEFGQLTGALGTAVDKSINQTAIGASDEPIKGISDKFKWTWEPGAEHCDTCSERNGQVKTYDEWVSLGLPGAGTTVCTIYCKCALLPV